MELLFSLGKWVFSKLEETNGGCHREKRGLFYRGDQEEREYIKEIFNLRPEWKG